MIETKVSAMTRRTQIGCGSIRNVSYTSLREKVQVKQFAGRQWLTKLDARVILSNLLTVLVGEEHVGGETTLGSVGVCDTQTMLVLVTARQNRAGRSHLGQKVAYPSSSCPQAW